MAATATPEQTAAAERAAAKGLLDRLKSLEDENGGLKKWKDEAVPQIEAFKKLSEAFKDVDPANVLKLVDQMKSRQEALENRIRLSKGGIYVPGLGDEKEKFSVHAAARAIVNKNWDDAGFEKEVFDNARKAVTKGPGHIVGVDSQGGFFVPDQIIPEVIGAIYAASQMLALDGTGTTRVSLLAGLTGIPVTIPKFLGGMVAYWMGEQDKYVESAVRLGNISLQPRKLGVLTRITDEMRRFSSYGFETLMRNDMVRAAAALIDWTIIFGTGTTSMPRGTINAEFTKRYYAETHSDVAPAGSAVGGELMPNDLDNMRGVVTDQNIPINNSWAWVSHPRYFRRLKQTPLTYFSGQTTGGGYLFGGPLLTDDAIRNVIGDFAQLTFMPTRNNAGQDFGATPATPSDKKYGAVIGANWSEVLFGRWGGLEMAEDGGVGKGFPTDESYIKMRMYADVAYRVPEAIVIADDVKVRDA